MKREARRRLAVAMVLLTVAAAAAYWYFETPRIASVDPLAFSPGEVVAIRGRNFGSARGKSRVFLDSSPLTQSSYISWTDDEIKIIPPPSLDSGLLLVATPFGKSNPEIVISSAQLPGKPENAVQAAAGPSILAINPPEATIGSLVEIDGINFGSNIQFSDVRFSRNTAGKNPGAEGADSAASLTSPDADYVVPEDPGLMYESWDDKSISLRVPEGAGSGTVIVRTPQGEVRALYLQSRPGLGREIPLQSGSVFPGLQGQVEENSAQAERDDRFVYAESSGNLFTESHFHTGGKPRTFHGRLWKGRCLQTVGFDRERDGREQDSPRHRPQRRDGSRRLQRLLRIRQDPQFPFGLRSRGQSCTRASRGNSSPGGKGGGKREEPAKEGRPHSNMARKERGLEAVIDGEGYASVGAQGWPSGI